MIGSTACKNRLCGAPVQIGKLTRPRPRAKPKTEMQGVARRHDQVIVVCQIGQHLPHDPLRLPQRPDQSIKAVTEDRQPSGVP